MKNEVNALVKAVADITTDIRRYQPSGRLQSNIIKSESMKALEATVPKLQEAASELQGTSEQYETEAHEAQANVEELTQQLFDAKAEVTDLSAQLQVKTEEVATLQQEIRTEVTAPGATGSDGTNNAEVDPEVTAGDPPGTTGSDSTDHAEPECIDEPKCIACGKKADPNIADGLFCSEECKVATKTPFPLEKPEEEPKE